MSDDKPDKELYQEILQEQIKALNVEIDETSAQLLRLSKRFNRLTSDRHQLRAELEAMK